MESYKEKLNRLKEDFRNINKRVVEKRVEYQLNQLGITYFSLKWGIDTANINFKYTTPTKNNMGVRRDIIKSMEYAFDRIKVKVRLNKFDSSLSDDGDEYEHYGLVTVMYDK